MTIHRMGKKPKAAPSVPGQQRLTERHAVHQDGDHDGEHERHQRRDPGGHPQYAEHHEQQEQRQGGDKRAPGQGMRYRIENLLVHGDHLAGMA